MALWFICFSRYCVFQHNLLKCYRFYEHIDIFNFRAVRVMTVGTVLTVLTIVAVDSLVTKVTLVTLTTVVTVVKLVTVVLKVTLVEVLAVVTVLKVWTVMAVSDSWYCNGSCDRSVRSDTSDSRNSKDSIVELFSCRKTSGVTILEDETLRRFSKLDGVGPVDNRPYPD